MYFKNKSMLARKQNLINLNSVKLNDINSTLKSTFYDEHKLVLKLESKMYEPIIFNKKDVDERKIYKLKKLIQNTIKH